MVYGKKKENEKRKKYPSGLYLSPVERTVIVYLPPPHITSLQIHISIFKSSCSKLNEEILTEMLHYLLTLSIR